MIKSKNKSQKRFNWNWKKNGRWNYKKVNYLEFLLNLIEWVNLKTSRPNFLFGLVLKLTRMRVAPMWFNQSGGFKVNLDEWWKCSLTFFKNSRWYFFNIKTIIYWNNPDFATYLIRLVTLIMDSTGFKKIIL
jgi:hypothetical protein